jgi:hypothetical protein
MDKVFVAMDDYSYKLSFFEKLKGFNVSIIFQYGHWNNTFNIP